jgi:hypothetical protein
MNLKNSSTVNNSNGQTPINNVHMGANMIANAAAAVAANAITNSANGTKVFIQSHPNSVNLGATLPFAKSAVARTLSLAKDPSILSTQVKIYRN